MALYAKRKLLKLFRPKQNSACLLLDKKARLTRLFCFTGKKKSRRLIEAPRDKEAREWLSSPCPPDRLELSTPQLSAVYSSTWVKEGIQPIRRRRTDFVTKIMLKKRGAGHLPWPPCGEACRSSGQSAFSLFITSNGTLGSGVALDGVAAPRSHRASLRTVINMIAYFQEFVKARCPQ